MLMHKYCPNFKNCGQIKKTNDKWNDWYNQHLILSQYMQFSIHILYVGIENVRLSVISKVFDRFYETAFRSCLHVGKIQYVWNSISCQYIS